MTLIFSSLVDPICEVIEEDGGGGAALSDGGGRRKRAVFSLDYFNVHFFSWKRLGRQKRVVSLGPNFSVRSLRSSWQLCDEMGVTRTLYILLIFVKCGFLKKYVTFNLAINIKRWLGILFWWKLKKPSWDFYFLHKFENLASRRYENCSKMSIKLFSKIST